MACLQSSPEIASMPQILVVLIWKYMGGVRVTVKQPCQTMQTMQTKTAEMLEATFYSVQSLIHSLPLFSELDFDLFDIVKKARIFRQFQHVIIFGIGGSCFGGKLLASLKRKSGPTVTFIDNIDSYEWNNLFENIDINTTGVISISKSGNTTETLCQTFMAIQRWSGIPLDDHFLFITDPGNSALRELADFHDIECLDHPSGIGGRFSIFSVVGLLPALIAGTDAMQVVRGAKIAVQDFLDHGASLENPALANAFFLNSMFNSGINVAVLFCYANRLLPFADWYSQLLAESLGKTACDGSGKRFGVTPVIALGTVAQHSQLQLYVDGPNDKCFTILSIGEHPETARIDVGRIGNPISKALNGHTMAELMRAHQQATTQTLLQKGAPVRLIHLQDFEEETLGKLLMFAILETISTGFLWNVDPFDQPGVKQGKSRVIELMNT
jgi:glucose-6-phosphate isomerase